MTILAEVLDRLLPGGDGFPPASAVRLEFRIAVFDSDRTCDALIAHLPEDFELHTADAQISALEAIEVAEPNLFRAFLVLTYRAYYAAPAVQQVIEVATGYRAGPPQPQGYPMEPFDPAWLAVAARRAPLYRKG